MAAAHQLNPLAGGAFFLAINSSRKKVAPMYEILFAVAAIANIGSFLFQLQDYMQERRKMKGGEKRTDGNQSF